MFRDGNRMLAIIGHELTSTMARGSGWVRGVLPARWRSTRLSCMFSVPTSAATSTRRRWPRESPTAAL